MFVRVLVGKSAVMPDLPMRLARKWAGYAATMTPEQMIVAAAREALEEAEKIARSGFSDGESPLDYMRTQIAAALAALREGTTR